MRSIVLILAFLLVPFWNTAWAAGPVSLPDIAIPASGNPAILVCPANAARFQCSCTNNDPAVNARVGDSTTTSAKGQRVGPGGAWATALNDSGAYYAVSEGAALTFSCTDSRR